MTILIKMIVSKETYEIETYESEEHSVKTA